MKENFFIFVERLRNFRVSMRYLLYGAKISRPEHRALANVKEGDVIFVYVMEQRALYGPYVARQRLFEDGRDIGWRVDGRVADWPHRVPMRPWSIGIGVLSGSEMPYLMTFLRRNMVTLRDLSELHQRYLNALLYDEGAELLGFFLRRCKWKKPRELVPDFGREAGKYPPPLDAKELLERYEAPPEYAVELYLLQNVRSLEEIVGAGVTEVYNQLYMYQRRFLDVLALHKHGDYVLKATVVEIKTNNDPRSIKEGLEELGHYMYWVTDIVTKDSDVTYGVLLTPFNRKLDTSTFREKARKISEFYGVSAERMSWVGYTMADRELHFELVVP